MASVYDFTARTLQGQDRALAEYRGKVLLIVNTATECGFTPQLGGLEALHKKYAGRGFEVLGFPSNQFHGQEPRNGLEIADFCTANYGVTFPMFEKIDVKGANAHPLFDYLTRAKRGFLGTRNIKWNFTKFLVGKDGAVLARYAPTTTPAAIDGDIAEAL